MNVVWIVLHIYPISPAQFHEANRKIEKQLTHVSAAVVCLKFTTSKQKPLRPNIILMASNETCSDLFIAGFMSLYWVVVNVVT